MSQATGVIPVNQSGTDYRTLHNAANAAINTSHKGASRPSYVVAGMLWIDDSAGATAWALKLYDGTDDITLGTFNTSTNVFTASGLASTAGYLSSTFASNYATTTGSANAYVLTLSPVRTVYTAGEVIFAKANFSNTGAATININSLGAKAIKKNVGDDLAANDVLNGQLIALQYDGINFQLLSGSDLYWINNLAAITTLEDTDAFPFSDASDSSKSKKITLANMKSYFGTNKIAIIADHKASGTAGGTFTSGAWRTRDLNTEVYDVDNIVSVSGNQFVLGVGTFHISAKAPCYDVDLNQLKIYNITNSADIAVGVNSRATSVGTQCPATVEGVVTITTGTKTFEIQHRGQTTRSTDGFGQAHSFGTEVYAQVVIRKIA